MVADALHRDFPYYNNVNLDPRTLGFQAGLVSFLQFTTSARIDMWAGHLNQAMVLDGAEPPLIFAGPESNLGEYEFTKTRRNQDIMVIACIPKYPRVRGFQEIQDNPRLTVIYQGMDDNLIHYMDVDRYTKGSDGFGYQNVFVNTHRLQPGDPISKDTILVTSPIHKDGLYCFGTNATIAYMTMEDTIEDAMLVSQSFADKATTTEIHQKTIIIDANQHPINIYGDPNEVKFLPDIGECVGADGVLAAFRPISADTFISDTMREALNTRHDMHDDIYYAKPGAQIIDLDFVVARNVKVPRFLYTQVDKYTTAITEYYQQIVNAYNLNHATNKHKLSDGFHNLVNRAIQRLLAAGVAVHLPNGVQKKSKIKMIAKNKRPVDFMQVTITYMSKRRCANGFKLSGRDGHKGVISRIIPDADMPVDDYGFRADIVIDPSSVFARMTMGPLYEPAINRTSEFVRRRVVAEYNQEPHLAWETLLDYYNDINPNYAALIKRIMTTDSYISSHIENCIKHGIALHIPPGLNTINLDLIQKLRSKWGVMMSPVTFTQRDMDNNLIGTFRTKKPVCIGSKYIVVLCKLPDPSSPGVAHISQYNTPMKTPPADRIKHPIRQSPIRLGEDEGRIGIMDLEDAAEWVRLMCLQANSPKGVEAVCEALLTEAFPTRINRINLTNAELLNSNTIVLLFRHLLATAGLATTTHGPYPQQSLKEKLDVPLF